MKPAHIARCVNPTTTHEYHQHRNGFGWKWGVTHDLTLTAKVRARFDAFNHYAMGSPSNARILRAYKAVLKLDQVKVLHNSGDYPSSSTNRA